MAIAITKHDELDNLTAEFDEWRSTKEKPTDEIPMELWDKAVDVCKRRPLLEVSQRLRLNYTVLKDRLKTPPISKKDFKVYSNGHAEGNDVQTFTEHISRARSRNEFVDPEKALIYLRYNNYNRQRKLRPRRVDELKMIMERGEFREASPIDFAVVGNEKYLVNGQHTLHAIMRSQRGQVLTITDHYLDRMGEIPKLYASFDRNLIRTHADALGAFGAEERIGVKSHYIGKASAALPLVLSGFDVDTYGYRDIVVSSLKSPILRMNALLDWQDEVVAYFRGFDGSKNKQSKRHNVMTRAAVASVALATFRYSKDVARRFWDGAMKDDGLRAADPRKKLLNFLIDTPSNMHRPPIYARYVASCWNAYYEQREMKYFRHGDLFAPIEIAGTPHSRKQTMVYLTGTGEISHNPISLRDMALASNTESR